MANQVINLENRVINLSLTIVTFCSYSNDCNPNSPSADFNAVSCLHWLFCGDMLMFKVAWWWARGGQERALGQLTVILDLRKKEV